MTSEATKTRAKSTAPWKGRHRVKDARTKLIPPIRCTEAKVLADKAGLSVGAFLRAAALGDAGPKAVHRPPIKRKELARPLGHLGKVGANLNQLANPFNRNGRAPGLAELTAVRQQVRELRRRPPGGAWQ